LLWAAVCAVLCVIFWEAVQEMIANYSRPDSYYSHGYLVPFVSLYFAWKQREALHRAAMKPSARGLWVIALCCVMVLLGDFLGFRIASQFALVFMLVGLVVALWGTAHAWLLWFPLAFLLFMIPIPISVTQALVLHVKILAIDCTVWLAQMLSLPMVRDGSYIAFGNDRLLVGEVCGGLRSLIALLALGAVIGYMSKARNWARFALFLLSAPVAILANVCRIFFLCVVGYVWGSSAATGRVHDISGLAIYAVAAVALSALELLLRRVAGKAVRPESGGAV
jgi:exosortase